MLTRRQFARGLALTVAGVVLTGRWDGDPEQAPLALLNEPIRRRLWALDGAMLTPSGPPVLLTARDMREVERFAEAVGKLNILVSDAARAFEAQTDFRPPAASRRTQEAP